MTVPILLLCATEPFLHAIAMHCQLLCNLAVTLSMADSCISRPADKQQQFMWEVMMYKIYNVLVICEFVCIMLPDIVLDARSVTVTLDSRCLQIAN